MALGTDINEKKRLVELLEPLAVKEWFTKSALTNVRFFRSNQYMPRSPWVYEPNIVIVAQGRKLGYLGDEVYTYGFH